MKVGLVVAPIWATKTCDSLVGHTLMVVASDKQNFVADDLVGASIGDMVLLSTRVAQPHTPIDTSIVAIVDQGEDDHVRQ